MSILNKILENKFFNVSFIHVYREFIHVYREYNENADKLFKEALSR
jgi:hypothetical protein